MKDPTEDTLHIQKSELTEDLWNIFRTERGAQFVTLLLNRVGLDPQNSEYLKTPERWLSYMETLCCRSFEARPETTSFPSACDEMIIIDPITYYSLCPHHLALVLGTAYVGYVPDGRVYGLSKVPRLVKWLAGHPVKQEDLTGEIAEELEKGLRGSKGVAVVLRATHTCMTTRGVKVDAACRVQTSKMTGCFLDPTKQARTEFLQLVLQRVV